MSEIEILNGSTEKERKHSESSDTEYDPQFKPVITLPEVDVYTNEEEETVLLKIRAKLYRFDSISDPPEWKERGTGELKILRHKDTSAIRVVMRRDKTLKVCANHFITPWLELKPSVGSEKAFVYTVLDFADEQAKSECLAIKFANVDNANLFKNKIEEAKTILTTDCDLYNGKGDKENIIILTNSSEESDEAENYSNVKLTDVDCSIEVTKRISALEVDTKDEKK